MRFPKRANLPALFVVILLTLVWTGCNGFFSDPALLSITVTPANPSLAVGQSVQLTAFGTFDGDSNQKALSGVTWSSGDAAVATVDSKTGFVQAVAVGTTSPTPVTITATKGAISGSTTVSVTAAALQSITITATTSTISRSAGTTSQFTATGHYADNSSSNITSSVNWVSDHTNIAVINTSGLASAATGSTTGTVNITASSGSITSTPLSLTVNQ